MPGTNFAIEFTRLQVNGQVRVTFNDGDQVQVSAPAARVVQLRPETLVIDNQGSSADFAIELPRLRPDRDPRRGVRVLLKQGIAYAHSRDAESGSWILPLTSNADIAPGPGGLKTLELRLGLQAGLPCRMALMGVSLSC